MNIGVCGVGKLGLPIALVVDRHGHSVVGYDPHPMAAEALRTRAYPYRELLVNEYLQETNVHMVPTVADLVAHSEILLVLVQTPHDPRYEGATRLPDERVDFDYSYLAAAVKDIAAECERQQRRVIVTVMSTVLPGTVDREIKPLLNEWTPLVYSPAFPAMGTAIPDFEHPEFYLLGVDDVDAAEVMEEFYHTLSDAPVVRMSVASGEATKVFYNSALTSKLQLANVWMEVCERLGGNANVDDVSRALSLAGNRLISSKYMKGGMGDGGGCHPRDLIALSAVARRLEMGYDFFGYLASMREKQTEWLASLVAKHAEKRDLPIVILGKAFKAGTNLTTGSPATLLRNILAETWPEERLAQWDPHIDPPRTFDAPAAFVLATNHDEFYAMDYPAGSVVIDPWGRFAARSGVDAVRVGRG